MNVSQLARARRTAKAHGWKVVYKADERLHFYGPSGQRVAVWYPSKGRAHDEDERQLDIIEEMEGKGDA